MLIWTWNPFLFECKYAENFTSKLNDKTDCYWSCFLFFVFCIWQEPLRLKETAVVSLFGSEHAWILQLNIEIVHWNNSVSRFFSVKSQTVSSLIWREDRGFELNCDRNNKRWEHPSSSIHLNQVESFTYRYRLKLVC